jgi:hypothetical protein
VLLVYAWSSSQLVGSLVAAFVANQQPDALRKQQPDALRKQQRGV